MKSNPKCDYTTKFLQNSPRNLTSLWAELITEELVRLKIAMLCIAPGSRSTPLVVACANRNELAKVVCQDERSAGFFALGYARATGMPAAVIVTSGSAVANLMPAVVEASNDRIPMLILTADRPPELRNVGANQTIDQVKIFGNYVRSFVDMPVPDPAIPLRFLLSTVDEAVHKSQHPKSGPVHLNFMFREPFIPDHDEAWNLEILKPIASWLNHTEPMRRSFSEPRSSRLSTIDEMAKLFETAKSGIIVAGAMDENAESSILRLSERTGWPILPDVLSGLRYHASGCVAHFVDLALLDESLNQQNSDVVIQVGGRIVSKRLQSYLDRNEANAFIIVDNHSDKIDPSCNATHRIKTQVGPFLDQLGCNLQPSIVQPWMPASAGMTTRLWLKRSKQVEVEMRKVDLQTELNEIYVARSLMSSLDDSRFLFVGSSMPIRDLNMFAIPKQNPARIYANRGASGIDGILSTACGVAKGLSKSGVLFCGDLTFLHDTNGLGLLKSLDKPLVIVVVNNQGGGIFAMLDIERQKEIFTPYFDASHDVKLSGLCEAYGIRHVKVQDMDAWKMALAEIEAPKTHLVVEVISDKFSNRDDHNQIRDSIREQLSSNNR